MKKLIIPLLIAGAIQLSACATITAVHAQRYADCVNKNIIIWYCPQLHSYVAGIYRTPIFFEIPDSVGKKGITVSKSKK